LQLPATILRKAIVCNYNAKNCKPDNQQYKLNFTHKRAMKNLILLPVGTLIPSSPVFLHYTRYLPSGKPSCKVSKHLL